MSFVVISQIALGLIQQGFSKLESLDAKPEPLLKSIGAQSALKMPIFWANRQGWGLSGNFPRTMYECKDFFILFF